MTGYCFNAVEIHEWNGQENMYSVSPMLSLIRGGRDHVRSDVIIIIYRRHTHLVSDSSPKSFNKIIVQEYGLATIFVDNGSFLLVNTDVGYSEPSLTFNFRSHTS